MNARTITVKLFATLRKGRFDIKTFTLPETVTSVSDVCRMLGLPEKEVALMLVNHRHVEMDHVLADGETLALFPPVGGG